MGSHGWIPGNFLGASGALGSGIFSAGSTTHIRAPLKDNRLGLGAATLADEQATGLDAFQGLLGRLNGKSGAELEINEQLDDRKLINNVESRWKTMRFVRGGLLVHKKIETLADIKPNDAYNQRNRLHSHVTQKLGNGSERGAKKDAQTACAPIKPKKQNSVGDNGDTAPSGEPAIRKKRKKSEMQRTKEHLMDNLESGKSREISNTGSVSTQTTGEENIPKSRIKEQRPMGRHIIRSRQKKFSLMDAKSLNEVNFILIHIASLIIMGLT